MTGQDIRGIVFDKDGTLFDFAATWSPWARTFLLEVAEDDTELATRIGQALGYDLATGVFAPTSPVIAGTPAEISALVVPFLPHRDRDDLFTQINRIAQAAPMAEAVPLGPLLTDLQRRGLRLGVATNDAEAPARAHLAAAGVAELFDMIAGSDSGFGGKPEPGQLLGFCAQTGLRPDQVIMVGDSTHDLTAARAAGMLAMAVLTGIAKGPDLAPHADVVLPDIGHLPAWLDRSGG